MPDTGRRIENLTAAPAIDATIAAALPAVSEPVGRVLGSIDATPLEFWIGVEEGSRVQLDDMVVVETALPDASTVRFFGVVDVVRKRYEGAPFDSDAFRAAAGTMPVEVSYAAHVQVTRIDPEVFVPPHPGDRANVARGEDLLRALCFDRMERRLAVGLTRAGEPVYANLEFLDGTRGAHASISGVSGVATKTSYATFLLYSLFHGDALGADAINAKALIFNVKGEDLLWLDRPNVRIDDAIRAEYARLGLTPGPFRSVGLFAPVRRRSDVPLPDTGGRQEGVRPYLWTLREFARDGLLRFCFAEEEDARQAQLWLVVRGVERALERAAREGDAGDPAIELAEQRVESFSDLVTLLDDAPLDFMVPGAVAGGTKDAFRRRLHMAAQHLGHLVRGDTAVRGGFPIDWEARQVTVVDIHTLHSTAQMFVVGVLLKRMMELKETRGTSRPLVFVVLDELNKYAPRARARPTIPRSSSWTSASSRSAISSRCSTTRRST